ncbi:MAG TPA: hypothetical protein VN450_06215 [Candidatus Methylomirabilis sp.]|nr:hypothetical protein [Candidatus Methylomirabilis sp.]
MDCGIALLFGNWWAGLLTWMAFAVVATAVITFVAARRRPEAGVSTAPALDEIRRLSDRVEELARRLDSLERPPGA